MYGVRDNDNQMGIVACIVKGHVQMLDDVKPFM